MDRLIVLLRGINVGSNRKVPMEALRELCRELGFARVESYIQSGNLVLSAPEGPEAVVAKLEPALARRFGFDIDVVARTAAQWAHYAAGSPFPEAAEQRPHLLHLALSRQPLKPGALAALRERAAPAERLEVSGDAFWVDFAEGVARSKLTPAAFNKAAGSPVTARNWRTVLELNRRAGSPGSPS